MCYTTLFTQAPPPSHTLRPPPPPLRLLPPSPCESAPRCPRHTPPPRPPPWRAPGQSQTPAHPPSGCRASRTARSRSPPAHPARDCAPAPSSPWTCARASPSPLAPWPLHPPWPYEPGTCSRPRRPCSCTVFPSQSETCICPRDRPTRCRSSPSSPSWAWGPSPEHPGTRQPRSHPRRRRYTAGGGSCRAARSGRSPQADRGPGCSRTQSCPEACAYDRTAYSPSPEQSAEEESPYCLF
jgi:hypothetical protein